MSQKKNLLVAASGTGGHIFPALSVTNNVKKYWNIHWLGIKQRLDSDFIPKQYSLSILNIRTPKNNIFIIFQQKILRHILQFKSILKNIRTIAVFHIKCQFSN